jgi:hypothetical protein
MPFISNTFIKMCIFIPHIFTRFSVYSRSTYSPMCINPSMVNMQLRYGFMVGAYTIRNMFFTSV